VLGRAAARTERLGHDPRRESPSRTGRSRPRVPRARVEETATEKRVVAGDSLRDGKWTFTNGVLHGEGGVSHIFSPRGDYENFVYSAEIKI
jgi:hypothetical protein